MEKMQLGSREGRTPYGSDLIYPWLDRMLALMIGCCQFRMQGR